MSRIGGSKSSGVLRRRAEKVVSQRDESSAPPASTVLRLTHELQVHQIELELQNEELRRARDEIKANYDELYDVAPVGYLTFDQLGVIRELNLTTARMLGHPRPQLIGTHFADCVAPHARDAFALFMRRLTSREGTEHGCMLTLLQAGNIEPVPIEVYIEASPWKTRDYRAVMVDITSARQAQLGQRQAEERLKLAVAAAQMGVWQWDCGTPFMWLSPECADILGFDRLCIELEDFRGLVHADEKAAVAGLFRENGERERRSLEFRIARADKRVAWIEAHCQAQCDLDGNVRAIVGTAIDISERKAAEDALQAHQAQLEAANRELENFTHSVAQALREPLRGIEGFAQALGVEHGARLDDDGRHCVQMVRDGSQHIERLIASLSAFARLTGQRLDRQTVNMTALAHSALRELGDEQRGRTLQISVDDLPAAEGDAALLKEVWVNLLANALKFSRGRKPALIRVGCETTNGKAAYFVRDNGAGFDMRYVEKAFTIFQRLHTADELEGVGVGLSIVQRIVSRHGGHVWARAAKNQGATFYFTLD